MTHAIELVCSEARSSIDAGRFGEGDPDWERRPASAGGPAQTCVSTSRYRPHATQALKTIGEYRYAAGIAARAPYEHGGTFEIDAGREGWDIEAGWNRATLDEAL